MAQSQYIAEVKSGLLLELPQEAGELHLKPGDRVRIQVQREQREIAEVLANEGKRFSALGRYAFVAGGSEEFARAKHAEIEREDRAR